MLTRLADSSGLKTPEKKPPQHRHEQLSHSSGTAVSAWSPCSFSTGTTHLFDRASSPAKSERSLTLTDYFSYELDTLIKLSASSNNDPSLDYSQSVLTSFGSAYSQLLSAYSDVTPSKTRTHKARARLLLFLKKSEKQVDLNALEKELTFLEHEHRYSEFVCHLHQAIEKFPLRQQVYAAVKSAAAELEHDAENDLLTDELTTYFATEDLNSLEKFYAYISASTTHSENYKKLVANIKTLNLQLSFTTHPYQPLSQTEIDRLIDQEIYAECYSYQEAKMAQRKLDKKKPAHSDELTKLERDVMSLKEFLETTQKKDPSIILLANSSLEQFNQLKKSANEHNIQSSDGQTQKQEDYIETAEEAVSHQVSAREDVLESTITQVRKMPEQQVANLTEQTIDLTHQDKCGQSLFEKVVALGDIEIIDALLTYAKKQERYDVLFLFDALNNLIDDEKKNIKLIILAMQGCLFDQEIIKKLRSPVRQTLFSTEACRALSVFFSSDNNFKFELIIDFLDQESLSKILKKISQAQLNILIDCAIRNDKNNIVCDLIRHCTEAEWSILSLKLQEIYCQKGACGNKVKVPTLIWDALQEKMFLKQQDEKKFKTMLGCFEETIDHVVSQHTEASKRRVIYSEKLNLILNASVMSYKSEATEIVVDTLLASPKIKKHSSILRLSSRTSTEHYLLQAKKKLKSLPVEAEARLSQSQSSAMSTEIPNATFQQSIKTIEVTIEKQKEIAAREALASTVFKKAIYYLEKRKDRNEKYQTKYNTMKSLIQQYSEGTLKQSDLVTKLQDEINPRNSADQTIRLGTPIGWFGCFGGTKTATYVKQGLRNAELLNLSFASAVSAG